ncbi:MAG TPA: aspartate/glutamate racemase family protein [Candidatus Acidoferrales bacterium]|nr:aspartate/glutamate racemase family protein [Candidatus Acidoferrales bacterium]
MKIMVLGKKPRRATPAEIAEIEKAWSRHASPDTRVEAAFPDDFEGSRVEVALGDQKMLNGLDHIMEAPALIRKIVWAAENGFDAVIQTNTFDPGIDGARLAVSIPVIGPFRTTMHVVANLVDRIGLVVPLDSHVPYTWRLLRTMGMDGFVTGIRSLGIYGTDLAARKQEIAEKTAGLIRALVNETGAEGVIPLGAALIPQIVDPADLQAMTNLPVYNTRSISMRFAELCLSLGLSHSPLAYPRGKIAYRDFVGRLS